MRLKEDRSGHIRFAVAKQVLMKEGSSHGPGSFCIEQFSFTITTFKHVYLPLTLLQLEGVFWIWITRQAILGKIDR